LHLHKYNSNLAFKLEIAGLGFNLFILTSIDNTLIKKLDTDIKLSTLGLDLP